METSSRRFVSRLVIAATWLALGSAVFAAFGAWIALEHFASEPEDLYACVLTTALSLGIAAGCWIVGRRLRRAV